ncbi:hypothetical protein QR680_008441 [Steinernema hermaphroditum]|uniref:UNC-45/Cro1/She4 central domain-containing protein n=1 Tax=Steinernema hermaphroditum TaxID=289476 RepID=A0AA39M707_9BILA|nr:hypothetical protein QR680_008441 [Steinernema hermaphroditum]
MSLSTAEDLRIAGNEAFKAGDYLKAVEEYTAALQLNPEAELRATLYKNRSFARLKLEEFEGCEHDCTKALEFNGVDSKSLYRRALSREQLDNIKGAFEDAREAQRLEPKDKNVTDLLQRLLKKNAERQKKLQSAEHKAEEMRKLAFDKADDEQQLKALNNLLVLARDSETGAVSVWQNGGVVARLLSVIENDIFNNDHAIAAIRVIDELCRSHKRALQLIEILGIPKITRLMSSRDNEQYLDAAGVVIQRLFNGLSRMDRTKEIKPDPEWSEENKVHIVRLILELEEMLTSPQFSAKVRETTIDLFVKNLMHMDGGLPRGWSWRFVEDRGLLKLLHCSAQIPEQCEYPVTAETRQHLAICLTRLHDDMVFDTKRAIFKERLDAFFAQLFTDMKNPKTQVMIASALITLLQGPVDVGMNLVTNDDIMAMTLTMAASDDHLLQSVAAELIVQTVSKHERATSMLKYGVPILRKLYESEDENVKVRALMGLCKCAAAGGDDSSRQTMQEGSTMKLAKTCKKFLLDVDKYSVDVRRFACEGLSYLTLDADVKEMITDDPLFLQALICLAKSAGPLCVYTLASIYVNLTNSYEKPKVDEEMVKLAQFAKHHVPETHPKDTDDCVERRVRTLVKDGAVASCIAVSKTESKNALDQLARCMLAFSEHEELRGQVLSEGGAKLLLTLTKEANPEGQIKAAHALAKLGSNADPSIAFPGQRAYEVVKPMAELLHPDIDGRANYDALLTLTNLASVSDSVRKRIMKEKVIPKAEEFWFMTDHDHLRDAAAEFLLNMLFLDEFYDETCAKGTDRVKLWTLYCAEEDERLQMVSSAAFSILTHNPEVCQRIIDEMGSWIDLIKEICASEHPEIQKRCMQGVANMVASCEKVASEMMKTDIFHVLIAISKHSEKGREEAQKEAKRALEAAVKFGVIAPTDRQLFEEKHKISTIKE